ncbi:MAG: TaqI-like C-terminal specificity domain-containing protein, partial [Cyclobacteriaceae bacterium]
KAFQELVLYYLRERITTNNLNIKYLIATNINEWFIFDAQLFEKEFAQSKSLVKQFKDFEERRLSGTDTSFFYDSVARPFIDGISHELSFTYFDIRSYEKPLRNRDKQEDKRLIALFKLLSPQHLLKLPFANDSNSLDKRFYAELLHIIGLEEVKDGGKKVIERKSEGKRNPGSLLENAINIIDERDRMRSLDKPYQFGESHTERLYTIGLELCITWVNRILFLKLLESQLVAYHKGDPSYRFLNVETVPNYDALDQLFFGVLAKKPEDRREAIKAKYGKVPYLNSSLFEPTELEQILEVTQLDNNLDLEIIGTTVLKNDSGKRRTGSMDTLAYLFAFLDAYDFSSEGGLDIQEDNKTLINASVLGLIFEKINGYKDGSFFTPGFITMYMCRETIRRSVVQKFNDIKGWKCKNYAELKEDLQDHIKENDRKAARAEANEIVNSLKICDPAVGSGHFLVSALNEMIAIKSDLKILLDRAGERISDYDVEVVNDELMISDIDEGVPFQYHADNKNSQRLQEALFHEKQSIIENCLFGVDINPNSVKICRLRLWIELLKNAYYVQQSHKSNASSVCYAESAEVNKAYQTDGYQELQTLPNIDINIKCGNSLISRFELDASLAQTFKNNKKYKSIEVYKTAVAQYKNTSDKAAKQELERLIKDIKDNFQTSIGNYSDPNKIKLAKLGEKLYKLTGIGKDGFSNMLFEPSNEYGSKGDRSKRKKEIEKIKKDIEKVSSELEEIKNNKIYENAFEWRFEFPEVLNDDGDFIGFDTVIGNPPYIRQEELSEIKPYLSSHFETFAGTADLYVYFVELGMSLMKSKGGFTFIIPNKWMRAGYGQKLRVFVKSFQIQELLDFGDLPVFEEATTYPLIISLKKSKPIEQFQAVNFTTLDFDVSLKAHVDKHKINVLSEELADQGWTLTDSKVQNLLSKLRTKGKPLGEYVKGKIYRGVLTGLNEAFVIDEETKNGLIAEDPNSAEVIKPFLAGRDIKRYQQPESDKYLILIKNGNTKSWFGNLSESEAWKKLSKKFPSVSSFLAQYELPAKKRYDQGQYWWELRACDYYNEFEKQKIIVPAIVKHASYGFDNLNHYSNDKTSIIPTNDFNLLGILCSSTLDFYLKSIASTKQNGYYEYKPIYVSQLPIINDSNKTLAPVVTQILDLKKANPKVDTSALEKEIDRLVYELYELTPEEIAIVEESVK